MLLNYLYPELTHEWIVSNKGSFYRNYSDDIMSLYLNERQVELSRDGFLKLLPEGVLTNDDEFKKVDVAEKYKILKRREHLLNEAFLPFDTFYFRYFMMVEQQVADLLNTKLEYILNQYFGFNLEAEKNPRYSFSDTTQCRLPLVRYDLLIDGLEAEKFRELYSQLMPLNDFITEWFMPMEVVCQIKIKEHNQPQQVNTRLVLDYNSEL